jgi:L-amino acid N-acyltransferase YncA
LATKNKIKSPQEIAGFFLQSLKVMACFLLICNHAEITYLRLSMIIRQATLQDIPAITAIYAPNVLTGFATYEITPPDEAEMQARFEAVTSAGLPYLIAEIAGDIAGYAYASTHNKREGYKYLVEDSIYVKIKGQGVGKALLKQLIHICEAQGKRQMIAVIGDLQNAASINLHRSLGFTMVGVMPATGYKLDRWIDTVFMQRPLGEGDLTHPTGQIVQSNQVIK